MVYQVVFFLSQDRKVEKVLWVYRTLCNDWYVLPMGEKLSKNKKRKLERSPFQGGLGINNLIYLDQEKNASKRTSITSRVDADNF